MFEMPEYIQLHPPQPLAPLWLPSKGPAFTVLDPRAGGTDLGGAIRTESKDMTGDHSPNCLGRRVGVGGVLELNNRVIVQFIFHWTRNENLLFIMMYCRHGGHVYTHT